MTETAEPEEAGAPATPVASEASQPAAAVGVLDQVRERGFITTGEIFAAFPDLEPDTNELRELWEMFESRGIKVLDEIAEERRAFRFGGQERHRQRECRCRVGVGAIRGACHAQRERRQLRSGAHVPQ